MPQMCKILSTPATQPTELQTLKDHKPSLRPCRSCWKTFSENHSLHLCLKQKRGEQFRKEITLFERTRFVNKHSLVIKSTTISKSNQSQINTRLSIPRSCLSENLCEKLDQLRRLFTPPEPVQPIPDLPISPFKKPFIPKLTIAPSKLPYKKRFSPIDYNRWHGHSHNNTPKESINKQGCT